MQRKPGFPPAVCNIKMPDTVSTEASVVEEDGEQQQKRLQLINFGNSQWGFSNWSWNLTKQDLDFVDFSNGKYCAGVAAFVNVKIKTLEIQRENVGYATCSAPMKGSAIHQARKCAVTNALRETLLSFGGNIATELMEIMEVRKIDLSPSTPVEQENNQNIGNKLPEPKNTSPVITRNEENTSSKVRPAVFKNPAANQQLPIAKAHPMPVNVPIAPNRAPVAAPARPPVPPAHVRPNPNVSYVLQPVMGSVVPPLYGPPPRMPHLPPAHLFPNTYYEYTTGPWHFSCESYDRHHSNVNLNFNIPPKNLVVNSRPPVECKNLCGGRQNGGHEGEPLHYGPQSSNQGCWIKPTIFYDGFWTEQKVKKWVAEQVEKQFPEDSSKAPSPGNNSEPPTSHS